ncbi:hypothetical protein IQ06DRAFT_49905 [Phaeosphaeriaceae sp. SRC1lsM3a]|nr:hypothetical protein IQ06DRAFT_49905 [Stagonospora sp. SRC1lsM3a]
MAAKIIAASWLLLHAGLVSSHANGVCKAFDIQVSATAPSAVYDIPSVNNDIEATAWAIHDTTRTTLHREAAVIRNTTTSGIFKIHGNLCIPSSSSKKDVLQIATHGVGYDSRYWDSAYQPEKHSYVEATLQAGYPIFTYDRLGVGQSDHPDAYNVVQGRLQLEILRQLTFMARNGTLYQLAQEAQPADAAFNALTTPSKIVHVGHSFGSILTSGLIDRYGELSDGAILTGFVVNDFFGKLGSIPFSAEYAATSSPPYDRPSGYVVCKNNGVQNIFFGGQFTPELLDYGNEIKQPFPIGEWTSGYTVLVGGGPSFAAPLQLVLAELDFGICQGDCNGLTNGTVLKKMYPNATAVEAVIQPNTGHALPLHNNATAGFQLTYDFLAKNGL